MPRNRTKPPAPLDMTALAESVNRMADVIERALAAHIAAFTTASIEAPTSTLLAVRHLTVEHLGRWVEIPGRPQRPGSVPEPSVEAVAGRLVGIRAGQLKPPHNGVPTRVLVLQQGSHIGPNELTVDRPVNVGHRDWS